MRIRSLIAGALMIAGVLLAAPAPVRASSPGLQLNPLKYEDTLTGKNVRNGYVDVSNPGDTTMAVTAQVQGFKQANLDGDLEFFLDDPIKQGITLDMHDFELGPRESVRVAFSVDPTKLPKGGVYAAIFFRTVPPVQTSDSSFVAESANIGTLLLLQNGAESEHIGQITQFDLPWLQLGGGLRGVAQYQNTNRTTSPIAFSPELTTRILPWGRVAKFTGPYVLPGSTRRFDVQRPGSYFGILPVSLRDTASGRSVTRWVVACTGWYAYAGFILLMLLIIYTLVRKLRRLPLVPLWLRRLPRRLWRKFRRRRPPVRRPIDGLSPKPPAADDSPPESPQPDSASNDPAPEPAVEADTTDDDKEAGDTAGS